jgi:hypothetical protein
VQWYHWLFGFGSAVLVMVPAVVVLHFLPALGGLGAVAVCLPLAVGIWVLAMRVMDKMK